MSKNNSLITPKGRVSYPNVFVPRLNELSGKMQYSIDLIFDKSTDISNLKNVAEECIVKKWGDKRPTNLMLPFKDGNTKKDKKTGLVKAEYKDKIFITFKTNADRKIGVVGIDGKLLEAESDFYAGCYARVSFNPFAYDKGKNKGASFFLAHVQKLADGEMLSGAPDAEDVFESTEADNPDNYKSDNSDLLK